MHFRSTGRSPRYETIDDRYGYECTWPATDEPVVYDAPLFQNGYSLDNDNGGPLTFNWGIRRSPVLLISGETCRYALAEKAKINSLLIPCYKYGDLRIRMAVGERSFWLDERGTV